MKSNMPWKLGHDIRNEFIRWVFGQFDFRTSRSPFHIISRPGGRELSSEWIALGDNGVPRVKRRDKTHVLKLPSEELKVSPTLHLPEIQDEDNS
jgi:hypothetical protein